MFSARLPIAICSAVLLAASVAQAADMPMYTPRPVVIEEYSNWYLRGDIGFSNQSLGSLFSQQYAGLLAVQNVDRGFDSAPFFGLGIGYNYNDWLRFDVTGEYRGKANFHGLDIGTWPVGMCGGAPPCYIVDRYNASKSEWTFLLNGYVDLGTWHNVTPFVGAGVGFSYNTIHNFGDFSTCLNSSNCSAAGGSDASFNTASKWNFAWALHAGLAYRVSKNLTVELAYRYLDLGNATTGTGVNFDQSQTFPPFEFRHLTSHDVKLGLRFTLDGLGDFARPAQYYQPQVYMPPPVYQPQYQQPIYQPPLRSRG
jgi:opacity protein-like surface antigen